MFPTPLHPFSIPLPYPHMTCIMTFLPWKSCALLESEYSRLDSSFCMALLKSIPALSSSCCSIFLVQHVLEDWHTFKLVPETNKQTNKHDKSKSLFVTFFHSYWRKYFWQLFLPRGVHFHCNSTPWATAKRVLFMVLRHDTHGSHLGYKNHEKSEKRVAKFTC